MTCGCNVVGAAWDEATKTENTPNIQLSAKSRNVTLGLVSPFNNNFPLSQIHKKKTRLHCSRRNVIRLSDSCWRVYSILMNPFLNFNNFQ